MIFMHYLYMNDLCLIDVFLLDLGFIIGVSQQGPWEKLVWLIPK